MFKRVGLITNIVITKLMLFTLCFVWGKQETDAYKRRAVGNGAIFWERNKNRVV